MSIIHQLPFDHIVLLTMHAYEWPLWHTCTDITRRLNQLGFDCNRHQVYVVLATLEERGFARNDRSHHSHWTLSTVAIESFLPNVTSVLTDEELARFAQ